MKDYKAAAALYSRQRAEVLKQMRAQAAADLTGFLGSGPGKDALEMLRYSGKVITIGMDSSREYFLNGEGLRSSRMRDEEIPEIAPATAQEVLAVVEDPQSLVHWLIDRLDEIAVAAPESAKK